MLFYVIPLPCFSPPKNPPVPAQKSRSRRVPFFFFIYCFILFYDHTIFIPEVMPVVCALPEEYLTFYKAIVLFQSSNFFHLFLCKRIFCHAFQVAYIFHLMYRERNRDLSSLMSPISERSKQDEHREPLQFLSFPVSEDQPHPPDTYLSPVSAENQEA